MRVLIICALSLLSAPVSARTPCTIQDYSDPSKAPDFGCPGPQEPALVPELRPKPSMGIENGATVLIKKKKIPVLYDAVLMDKLKVIELGLKIKGLRRLRWLERHKGEKLLAVERKYVGQRYQAQLKLEQERVKTARGQRDDARQERDDSRKWYRSFSFGFTVGAGTVVVVTAGIVIAVLAAR